MGVGSTPVATPRISTGNNTSTTSTLMAFISSSFRAVGSCDCRCSLCCRGWLFGPCVGEAAFLLGQARAAVDTHLTPLHLTLPHFTSLYHTLPHFTSPHLTSPHLTSPHDLDWHFCFRARWCSRTSAVTPRFSAWLCARLAFRRDNNGPDDDDPACPSLPGQSLGSRVSMTKCGGIAAWV